MTQTMDLNKMGLTDMSELEMNEIDGGGGGFWDIVGGWLIGKLLDNPEGVRDGFSAFTHGAYSGSQVGGGMFYK